MSKPFFVYTIYIASTPEKVFKALTDTDVTAKFWFGNAVISDWKTGAPVEFRREGKLIVQGKSAGIRSAAAAVLHVPLDARTFLWGRATRARCHRSRKTEGPSQAHRHARRLRRRQQGVRCDQQRLAARALQPQELPRGQPRTVRALV